MSYILDALKRADAERERGAAPGLHTRHQLPSHGPAAAGASRSLWLVVAGGVTVLVLAAFFWLWQAPGKPPPIAENAAQVPLVVSAAPVAVVEAPKVVVRPKTPAKAVTSAPSQAPLLADLPSDIRSQIPKISITGSVYSDSPAQRLLLVNNLVLAPGAQVAPDLTLQEIQRRDSVFDFKGTRFRVMH